MSAIITLTTDLGLSDAYGISCVREGDEAKLEGLIWISKNSEELA